MWFEGFKALYAVLLDVRSQSAVCFVLTNMLPQKTDHWPSSRGQKLHRNFKLASWQVQVVAQAILHPIHYSCLASLARPGITHPILNHVVHRSFVILCWRSSGPEQILNSQGPLLVAVALKQPEIYRACCCIHITLPSYIV